MVPPSADPARLVLASASPRRLELLRSVGIDPLVRPSSIVEALSENEGARDASMRLAREKAHEVAGAMPGRAVLAADTLVVVGERILGKPLDADDAKRMLRALSGRWHEVVTGVALATPDGRLLERAARTEVCFASIDEREIDGYVAGGEPYDKAGGYAIQGAAGWFVTEIRGSVSNVIGLPLELVREMLREACLPGPPLAPRR